MFAEYHNLNIPELVRITQRYFQVVILILSRLGVPLYTKLFFFYLRKLQLNNIQVKYLMSNNYYLNWDFDVNELLSELVCVRESFL